MQILSPTSPSSSSRSSHNTAQNQLLKFLFILLASSKCNWKKNVKTQLRLSKYANPLIYTYTYMFEQCVPRTTSRAWEEFYCCRTPLFFSRLHQDYPLFHARDWFAEMKQFLEPARHGLRNVDMCAHQNAMSWPVSAEWRKQLISQCNLIRITDFVRSPIETTGRELYNSNQNQTCSTSQLRNSGATSFSFSFQ